MGIICVPQTLSPSVCQNHQTQASWNPETLKSNCVLQMNEAQTLALQTMGTIIMHMSENKFV